MDKDKLEQFIRNACNTYAPTKPIFIIEGLIPREKSAFWSGDDITDFFKAMDAVNPNFLYIGIYETGSEAVPDQYKDLVYEVVLAFVFDGIYHIFTKHADWYDAMINEMNEDDKKNVFGDYDKLLNLDENEKSAIIESFSIPNLIDSEPGLGLAGLRMRFFNHLAVHNGFPDLLDIPMHGTESNENEDRLRDLANKLFDEVQKEWTRLENERVDGLIEKCKEWVLANGLNTITQSDIEVFLGQNGTLLSKMSKRNLWNKVKFSMKTTR